MFGKPICALALVTGLWAAGPVWAEDHADPIGDAEAGAEVYDYCVGCHEVGQGAENGIGPHLNGLFGRPAGSIEGFKYSKGLLREGKNGLVWELDKLDAYLENPKALVSDTRMSFDGLEDRQERNDVMAYLRMFSDNPQNIPEASPTARAPEVELSAEVLAIVGDPDYGEYLANECTTCHQRDGDYDGIPGIVSWPDEDFVIAMHAYKRKIRPHPVMQMMAGRLTDEEIAALAAYFGKLE
jgi:cytochrome c